MRRRTDILVCPALALLLAAPALRAETPFLTENWNGLNSNWTVAAGTPWAQGSLTNSASDVNTATRLLYSGAPAIQDYSVQTDLACDLVFEVSVGFFHYLRVSGNNYYRVEASYFPVEVNAELGIWEAWVNIYVYRIGSPSVLLASTATSCGITLKSSIQGNTIRLFQNGSQFVSVTDSAYASGTLGVGTVGADPSWLYRIGATVLAYVDTTPPPAPANLAAAASATRVNLSWTAPNDLSGISSYKIYRDGNYLGSSTAPSYNDVTVNPVTQYSYTALAIGGAGNQGPQSAALQVNTPPVAYSAPETGGPVEFAATWGAGPEKIALLTGALALRIPLVKLQHRSRGPGFSMVAAWNSQFWTWDAAGTRMTAMDVGYGLGWNFTLGGMYPVYNGNLIDRFEFQDAGAVIHKLYPTGAANQYKSRDFTYLLWDNAARTLTFTDGTVWTFDCYSRDPEPDAGTRYPTQLRAPRSSAGPSTSEAQSRCPGEAVDGSRPGRITTSQGWLVTPWRSSPPTCL